MPEENYRIKTEDKALFIKTLNQQGFLLEDKTWKIIEDNVSYNWMVRNKVITHNNIRREIDLLVFKKPYNLVIDCKWTEFTWIFSKAFERTNIVNYIYDSQQGMKTKTVVTNLFKTAWFDMNVIFDENGKLKKTNRDQLIVNKSEIRDHLRQVLTETEAYLSTERFIGEKIIPVIVTNAKLLYLEYDKSGIDKNGNLTDYDTLREVDMVVYNFPEILKWDKNQQIIKTDGESISDSHIKSVFIVNVNSLSQFFKKLTDFNLLG